LDARALGKFLAVDLIIQMALGVVCFGSCRVGMHARLFGRRSRASVE
jgi:hypothetical protein